MIDYLRNLFISWFNKILNWFSERQKKEMNTKKEIPFDKNKHADDDRQKRISEGFQALDEGCKSIANLRAEIEMSQTESKTFKDNEPKVNNDLDAPVPANNNIKGNPLFQRDGHLMPSLCDAPINMVIGRVAMKRNSVSVAMANGCVANERHYVSNNNLEENKMGLLQSKVIKFLGGTPAPKSEDECKQQIKDLEKKKLEFQQKEGVAPIKPVGQEKLLSSNISPISMRSNNDNSNWIDPNDLNNTFEYQDVDKKALNAIGTKIKQNVKQEIKNQLAESKIQEQLNNHEEKINKNTEDIKKNTEDIKKTQKEQIDLKKMIARADEQIADNKIRIKESEKMLEEMKQQTAEIKEMRKNQEKQYAEQNAKWMEMFGPYLKKQPTRNRDDNRESTNTSLSSFKYKNPFRNNKPKPRMERADMAHSYDENQ